MNILFTICGRAGSKGFKNKNLKVMNGVPLVYYTLAAIKGFTDRHSKCRTNVVLNTDSEELRKVIEKQEMIKGVTFVKRKPELAGDYVAKVDVIKDTYLELKKSNVFDVIIDLDITSPMRSIKDIENTLKIYTENSKFDLVFSVVKSRRNPYFNMVEKEEDGFYRKVCASRFSTRQQTPECFELNASIYAYRPSFLESAITKTILDFNCGISPMHDYLVLDIDSEEDFAMMSMLHRYYCENDKDIREVRDIAMTQC